MEFFFFFFSHKSLCGIYIYLISWQSRAGDGERAQAPSGESPPHRAFLMHHARRLVPLLTSFNLHVPLYSDGSTQWQRIRVSLVRSVRVRDRGFVRVERLLPIKSLRSEPRGLTDGWEALANERRDLRSALCTPRIRICFSVQHRRHNKDKNTRKRQLVLSFFETEKSVISSWARGRKG